MKPIVRVEGLSKQYRIGVRRTSDDAVHETFFRNVRSPWSLIRRNGDLRHELIWALKDVSFDVEPGEALGIVGRNGAGKSTLLKILSRITEPTSGRVELFGRVGSLLEVGTGFHPELTGRENVYLNGAILGMKKTEIEGKFDEIVAFAEIEKFIDTPVKWYSTGMYMRLAFAVAAHLEPEILIVDEVLAVGDASFQKKCLGKMGDVAKGGRTVLFVSHSMTAVKSLCDRVIWLDKGSVVEAGDADQVSLDYLQTGDADQVSPDYLQTGDADQVSLDDLQRGALSIREQVWEDPATAPGDNNVRLHRISIAPLGLQPNEPITVKTALQFNAAFWNYLPGAVLNFSVVLYSLEGIAIFNTGSGGKNLPGGLVEGSFVIPSDFLNDDTYTIRLLIVKDGSVALLDLHDLLVFEVHDSERLGNWQDKWVGAVRPRFDWELSTGN